MCAGTLDKNMEIPLEVLIITLCSKFAFGILKLLDMIFAVLYTITRKILGFHQVEKEKYDSYTANQITVKT